MKTIAISGKGGTGKSTLAALIIRWLSKHVSQSILAVDADSNVNLNDLLGVQLKETVGTIREEMKTKVNNLPGGMTKQQFLEYKIQCSLVESPSFDLIAMGRPEGSGCYCYANNILLKELETRVKEKNLILNRVRNSLSRPVKKIIEGEGLKLIHSIPEDEKLLKMDQDGNPIWKINPRSPAYLAVDKLMKILNYEKTKEVKP